MIRAHVRVAYHLCCRGVVAAAHRGGPLSQGLVHGHSGTCPLHNWSISLANGEAQGGDVGSTRTIAAKASGGRVLLCRASTLSAVA